jgi:hypothetical protein
VTILFCTLSQLFNTEYTSYCFCVSDGRHKWTVRKRFSDFATLDKELTQRYPKPMMNVLTLPAKSAFGSMSPSLINARQKGLDQYLKVGANKHTRHTNFYHKTRTQDGVESETGWFQDISFFGLACVECHRYRRRG